MKKIIFLLLGVIIFGCSEDDIVDPNMESTTPQQVLLKEIIEDGVTQFTYEYFENDDVKSINFYEDDSSFAYTEFEYLSDTIYERNYNLENELNSTTKYYSLSENTSRRDFYTNTLKNYRIYYFSGEGCGYTLFENFNGANDVLQYSNAREFLDENCSTLDTISVTNSPVASIYERIRDNANPYDKSTVLDFFERDNWGNTIKYINEDGNGEVGPQFSYESTFEYNSDNYPTSEVRTFLDGSEKLYTYIYY